MSSVRMLVRIMSSSSTSSTTGLRLSGTLRNSFSFLLQWNSDVEGGSVSPPALEGDGAAVVINHGAPHHHQAEAGADTDGLGGEALLKDFGLVLVADSTAGVRDPDVHHVAFQLGADGNSTGRFDGLGGIDNEIQDGLDQQVGIAFHFGQCSEGGFESDAIAELSLGKLDC